MNKVHGENSSNINIIILKKEAVEEVESFTYLGCIVTTNGRTDEDVKARYWENLASGHF